jgi:hypothetical protein
MKPGKIIGTLLGLALMGFAIGAYFSNEPASKTQQGQIAIVFALMFGFFTVIGNLGSSKSKRRTTEPSASATISIPPTTSTCPRCSNQISPEYAVCPYCGIVLKPKCPSCGKEISATYKHCPYCGVELKIQ